MNVGEAKDFRATYSDPDGDSVTTVFLLDGEPVAEGGSYRFEAATVGAHKLEVVADDGAGAKTVLARTISVAKKSAASAPPRPAPPPVAPVEKKVVAAATSWEGGVRNARSAYERALNAKSMRELEQVWLLPEDSLYRTRWKSKFSRPEELAVSVEILSIDKSGKQVRVVFNQREATPQRTRTWKYEALLIKRSSSDEWQIVENKVKR